MVTIEYLPESEMVFYQDDDFCTSWEADRESFDLYVAATAEIAALEGQFILIENDKVYMTCW